MVRANPSVDIESGEFNKKEESKEEVILGVHSQEKWGWREVESRGRKEKIQQRLILCLR